VDELGLLKVGPSSAGAAPGPACYQQGGTDPTVTDADLVLGYLDPDYFLGGKMPLNIAAAAEAINRKIAGPLQIDPLEAAWGIHEIVCENMAIASRIHILERGRDPRGYVMLAMGGAGPVHAVRVAQKLGCSRVLFPAAAGVFSALGLLVAPITFDFIHTRFMTLDDADTGEIAEIFAEMETEGHAKMSLLGIDDTRTSVQRSADMQYHGQGHQIKVVLAGGTIDEGWIAEARRAFDRSYRAVYHRTLEDISPEVVNWRCVVSSPVSDISIGFTPGASLESAMKGYRRVFFPGPKKRIECPVYERNDLPAGAILEGPAIIEETESTAVIHPGDRLAVDPGGSLIVQLK
jgi:N-methylhydantoinase A/oxoprolinase/acetone carboxylase beta subunit